MFGIFNFSDLWQLCRHCSVGLGRQTMSSMSWLARASRGARPTHRFAPALRTQQISREFSAVPAGQATRPHILWLYRRIIFAAARFPSKNRDKVYAEIRDEFRRNAALEPGSDAAIEQVALAQQSLRQLQAYTNMQRDDGSWELNMESNPMPKPPIANDPN